ncbi:MAG: YbhB/YbcL family Raf kinase inhibitor-like protein [Betaproteobacteria bacterium]|nr:YbhB/YbcL family Raf kinase inhibitor-like protein [Betaproteobacteria bacterium]MBU6512545.1 YbhB/YbcL family Raf kinase inhibitor-like protein [Betaproteobacteria bacterium]MDE1955745.1 YbhB/YbcL family Raf kinase inhibitor-like protein [Betaproteobacteria bacterium]MDE2153314.1 YbhB/YbcL family Raf kinase inhibitor-like protein [Betaproteobacteria bacterium]MDE2479088.1 YbhB/YbcL family Raf kinase inhibitor-like protein [Betaproteobacteria bacterium]
MRLRSDSFQDQHVIASEFAFCKPASVGHVALSDNRNPHLAWDEVPEGTRSFVLLCHDPDVPSSAEDVNREGRTVPASLPRVDFFHWVLVDLPPTQREIAAGSMSSGVSARGKAPLPGPAPRHGINDYTAWFRGDQDMQGNYFGYDGPCPPWNDALPHRYVFTLYALDLARCAVDGEFTGQQVREAMTGHILAHASITGTYTLNPTLASLA